MSNAILILGHSGSGKSTSIRTLPPNETFIINVIGKNLPFKGSGKLYKPFNRETKEGNVYVSDQANDIVRCIAYINASRKDIKYLVIDDCSYAVMNDFMRKCLVKGYDKFSEIAKSFAEIIDSIKYLREDLFVFVIMHVEEDQNGKTKPKTVGKMIDQYVCVEGNFTTVLHTIVHESSYKFLTNFDGHHMAKSPMGLFDHYIDNDLLLVSQKLKDYFNEDINM